VVHWILAESLGVSGKLVVQIFSAILVITSTAAYIVWIESPVRAMFADVPEKTFPSFLIKRDKDGSFTNALWTQAGVIIILIAIPLFGLSSIDSFFRLITDLSALSLVIPYVVLAAAFLAFRMKGSAGPFSMMHSNKTAVAVALVALLLGVAGFLGAGLDYYVQAETGFEAFKAILMTYGGPFILILLGFGLTSYNKKVSS
jgi:amino acid transporter